jgi:hypothetical protein
MKGGILGLFVLLEQFVEPLLALGQDFLRLAHLGISLRNLLLMTDRIYTIKIYV